MGREEEAGRNGALERLRQRVTEATPVLKPVEVTNQFQIFLKRFRAA